MKRYPSSTLVISLIQSIIPALYPSISQDGILGKCKKLFFGSLMMPIHRNFESLYLKKINLNGMDKIVLTDIETFKSS